LKKLFQEIIDFFAPPKPPSDVFYDAWHTDMKKYDYAEVVEMTETLKRTQPLGRIPALSTCIALVDSIAARNREEKLIKDRNEAEKFLRAENVRTFDQWGSLVMKLIKGLVNHNVTRGKYLEGARALNINVDPLERYYKKNNYELDKYAGTKGL